MEYNDYKKFKKILANKDEYVSIFYKRKKHNGKIKYREIISPNEDYKYIQSIIYKWLTEKSNIPIHDSSYAWMPNKSRELCAQQHVNQKYVLEIDIEDFFGNITKDKILSLFEQNDIKHALGLPIIDITNILLIFSKNKLEHLPQGFITSAYLANAIRYNIDCEITSICEENNLIYTNYGDNIIISGDFLYKSFSNEVIKILNKYKFNANYKKTKIMPYYREQQILGITINNKVRISKNYTNKIIGEVVYRLKNNIPTDASLKGKINTLRINANPRVYNYIYNLSKQLQVST